MLHSIRIQNFKSLKDVTLRLQDVNLLIGPNNSGKSNILKALEFLGRYIGGHFPSREELRRISYQHRDTNSEETAIRFTTCFEGEGEFYYYHLVLYRGGYTNKKLNEHDYTEFIGISVDELNVSIFDEVLSGDEFIYYRYTCPWEALPPIDLEAAMNKFTSDEIGNEIHFLKNLDGKLKLVKDKNSSLFLHHHFSDEKKAYQNLRNLSDLRYYNIQLSAFKGKAGKQTDYIENDASNLVSFIDYLNNNNALQLKRIEAELKKCVKDFELIRTPILQNGQEGEIRQITLFDSHGNDFRADEVSEGTLYFLALLCIIYQPNPPKVLLLEEPEKGIHPRRIKEVIDYIFDLAEDKGIQVILTTHSEQVVNQFKDLEENVFIIDKPGDETIVKNLQKDIIDESHQKSEENNIPKINYREALGDHWVSGLLGGVPA